MPFNNVDIDYFKEKPWACKCGCGYDVINPMFVHALNAARHRAGVPFVINSACRCRYRNLMEDGKSNSDHLTGDGVHIATPTSRMRFKVLEALLRMGITRIGIGRTFIHAGYNPANPQEVTWLY